MSAQNPGGRRRRPIKPQKGMQVTQINIPLSSSAHAEEHTSAQPKKTKKGRAGKIILIVFCVLLAVGIGGWIWLQSVLNGGISINSIVDNNGNVAPPPAGEDGEEIDIGNLAAHAGYTRKKGFYTFLMVGADKVATNTDTMILVAFDTENDKISLLQIPRDTLLNNKKKNRKVNAVFGNDGIEGLKTELTKFLGVPIDRYGIINLESFQQVVDAVEGVTVTVPEPGMQYYDPYQNLDINLAPGTQVLDGKQAEGFVRFRHGYADADLGRLKAQKAFISSLIDKLMSPQMILKAPQLCQIAFDNLTTDMSLTDMIYIANQGLQVDPSNIRFFSIPGEGVGANYGAYPEETMEIINTNFNPYTEDLEEDMFSFYPFTRENNEPVDISGTPLGEAKDTQLSQIIYQQDPSEQNPNAGEPVVHKPEENTSEPQQDPNSDGQEEQPQGGQEEQPENNGAKVILLNASGKKAILDEAVDKLTKAGYNIVKSSQLDDYSYETTMIIDKNEQHLGKDLTKLYKEAQYLSSCEEGAQVDVILILGRELAQD